MYRTKGGRFMTRSQIIALLLGAGVVAIGAGLAWRGVLPGFPSSEMASGTSAPAAAPTSEQATTLPPETKPTEPGQAQQEAAVEPNAAPPQPEPAPAQPVPTTAPDLPVFDTVRVEPSGDTVVAGHGAPEAKIALIAGNKVIAEVDADGAGNFVVVPPPLAPGGYLLALRSSGKDGAVVDSQQNIAVSVPPKGQKNVVVALAEPGKPSVILTDTAKPEAPAVSPPAAATAQPEVAFKTAEVDNGGFYASGTATPGADLRIYLNGTNLAEVTAGADGHWSLTVGKGLAPGHYAVRADVIDPTGKVLARAEVPFDVPVSVAEADAPAAKPAQTTPPAAPPQPVPAPGAPAPETSASPEPAPSSVAPETGAAAPASSSQPTKQSGNEEAAATPSLPTPSANDVVVPQIQTTTVARGDSLWRISRKVFGHGIRYTLIYEANADQIRDPSLIYPGQIFVLPHAATN
jgi:nucleoid-associated protein YgaU